MSGVARFLVAFLLSLLPALSWAQTAKSDYSVLIDADRDPATGCSVALPTAGRVDGIERRLTATVTSPLQVASLTLESCVDGRFDAPVALPGAPFPVGLDTGIAGADVIELAAPSGAVAALGGTVRLYFAARGPSSDDLLATADGSPNGAPILFEISPVPIPTLAGWSLLLLGFLLAAIAASRHRRGAAHTLSVLSLLVVLGVAFAAGFVLDGRTDDWQGVSPTGADPTGDSAPSTDIGAGFAAEEAGTLFFRVDVGDVEAPPSANQPPVFTSTPVTTANVASAYSYTIATSDPDGNALTLTAPTLPAWLTFTPGANGAGTLSGTPAAADAGSHPVALRVTDNGNPNLSANQAFTITVRAAGNGAPTATPQTLSTREDTALTITLTGSDPNNDPLTFALASNPASGALRGTAPNLTYTPNTNFNGSDRFTFTVSDGTATSAPATIAITVTPANDAPTATAQNLVTARDAALAITLTGSDPDNDPLSFAVATNPTNGRLSGTAPNLTYTPNTGFRGNDRFTFTVNDGTVSSAPATVSITVGGSNASPVANGQSLVTALNTVLAITLTGSDPDNDPLTFAIATTPANGALSGTAPNLTYTPTTGFTGTDSFTFTVDDGALTSAPATVVITVGGGNAPPVANGQSVSTLEDTDVAIVLTGADPDNDPLTFIIATNPTNGALSGTIPNLTYTPDANFNGADSFTFTVNDGTATSATATVAITVNAVNDAPTATAQTVATAEDTAVTITLAGTDPENDPLTFDVATNPTNGTLSGTAPNLTYTPNAGFNGSDSFTFTANDGTVNSSPATVSVSVGAANDPPTANNQSVSTPEDAAVTITLTGSDPDGDNLTFTIGTRPANGTLGAITPVNATSARVTYTPSSNFTGPDSFTFTVNDGAATSAPATVTITVGVINDAPVLDLDGTADDPGGDINFAATFTEDAGPLRIVDPANLTVDDPDSTTLDSATITLTNRPNDAAETLAANTAGTGIAASYTAATGVLLLAGPDSVANFQTVLRTVTYNNTSQDPDPADRSVTFVVDDGAATSAPATATVTVNSANDAPVVNGATFTLAENSANGANVGAPITFTDPDAGQTHTFAITAGNTNNAFTINTTTGQITVATSSALDFETAPTFSLTVQVTDNGTPTLSGNATVTINLTDVNDPPVVNAATFSLPENSANSTAAGTVTFTDPDAGQTHTFAITAGNTGNAFTINTTTGQITVATSSALDFEIRPSFSLTVQVTDNGTPAQSDTATVTVNLTDVNEAPAANPQSVTTSEDTPPVAITLTGSDPENQALSFALGTGPGNGVLSGTAPNLTYTPNASFSGADSFTFTVSDGINTSAAATVGITVNAVNDPPTAANDAATVTEDSGATAINVLANDTDPDGGPISINAVTQPANGAVVITGGGTGLTYQPNADYCNDPPSATLDPFTYSLTPGGSTATVTVTVTCVDDPPTAANDAATVTEDSGASAINVLANDTDPDGGPISITSVTQPANGTVFITGGGTGLTYQPNADYCTAPPGTALDTFTYTLTPGGSTATVTVTVNCLNDAPVLTLPGPGVNYDTVTPIILDATATVTDVDSPNFDTGVLTANVSTACDANDRLGVRNEGTGPNQIGGGGANVTYNPGTGAVIIGTIVTELDCATPEPLLAITLTANADLTATQALLRNLVFFSASTTPPATQRTVEVVLTDGGGGTSNTATKSIDLDAAPTVTTIMPANNATGVAINTDVVITFSEDVTVTGNWFQIACPTSGNRSALSGTAVTGGPTVFTINPTADFANGETCTVTVTALQVADQDTLDPPDNLAVDFNSTFTTVDVAPTVLASSTPTAGALVPTTQTVTLNFSEAVDVVPANIGLVCGAPQSLSPPPARAMSLPSR